MKRLLYFLTAFFLLAMVTSCNSTETQNMQDSSDIMSSGADAQTEALPPEETDCLTAANECALAFQSLFLKYLQYEENELSIKVEMDYALLINEKGASFFPVVDDEIKCYDDLKKFFMEYCTDEFAQELLDKAVYRDFDGKLYKADNGLAPAARYQYGCYINNCVLDGNQIIVDVINIGADNENFDIDLEYYCRMMEHDQQFNMTLIWENEHWLISDISNGYEDKIGYSYRKDITRSMHETN